MAVLGLALMISGCKSPKLPIQGSRDAPPTPIGRCDQRLENGAVQPVKNETEWCGLSVEGQGEFPGYRLWFPAGWSIQAAGIDEPAVRFEGVLSSGEAAIVSFQPIAIGSAADPGLNPGRPETWVGRLYNTRTQTVTTAIEVATGHVIIISQVEEVQRQRRGPVVTHGDLILYYSFTFGVPTGPDEAAAVDRLVGVMLAHLEIGE